jgi:hypothetical protein
MIRIVADEEVDTAAGHDLERAGRVGLAVHHALHAEAEAFDGVIGEAGIRGRGWRWVVHNGRIVVTAISAAASDRELHYR